LIADYAEFEDGFDAKTAKISKGAKRRKFMYCCRQLAVVAVAVALLNRVAPGDETAERAEGLARLTKTIEAYSIAMGAEPREALELVKSPVLRYSDTISPVSDGVVFVWTKAGRPEAVMAAHHGTQGHTWLEFRSLSLSPLTATWKDAVEWTSRTAGVEFQPIERAPQPDQSAARRLSQMRSMLEAFSASVSDNRLGRQELRLLAQPIYRYAQPERGIVDGGIFAFVLTTNPEFLVVVEAQTIEGKSRWMYSPARFTGRQCELRMNNQPVWPQDELPMTHDPTAAFFQMRKLVEEE
jgi:hypothetical protein